MKEPTGRRFIARDELLTVGQAAKRVPGISRSTIKYMIQTGRLKAVAPPPIAHADGRPAGKPWRRVRLSDVLALFQPREPDR